jgi:hypothetical protein
MRNPYRSGFNIRSMRNTPLLKYMATVLTLMWIQMALKFYATTSNINLIKIRPSVREFKDAGGHTDRYNSPYVFSTCTSCKYRIMSTNREYKIY